MRRKIKIIAVRWLCLLLSIVIVFAITGCSGEEIDPTSSGGDSTLSDNSLNIENRSGTIGSISKFTAVSKGRSGINQTKSGGDNTSPVIPPPSGILKLTENGQATATIVISASASVKVKRAAEDLQAYLLKISGATLKIGFDSSDRTQGNFVLVGRSAYTDKLGIQQPKGYPGNEKVILKRDKNYLVLLGNDDGLFLGTQFAVTMFLERLGCGWFGPEELWQVVPSIKTITVDSLNITHTPKFTTRQNNVLSNNPILGERWYLGGVDKANGHYLPHLVGKDVYFKTHPEWFSLLNGKRNNTATWWQYCYSNQALANEVAKKVIGRFDQSPHMMSFPVAANDGWETDWCECGECAKFPNDSDLLLTFANRIAKETGKKYPNRKVSILSYHSMWSAPLSSIKAEPNVEVMFCTETSMTSPIENGLYLGDTRHPVTHNTYRTSWKDNFILYKNKTNLKNISIWKWLCLAVDKPSWQTVPWVQGDVAIRDQNFWKKNGAEYVFYDQGPAAVYREGEGSYPLRWPLWFVAAKGMWDASLNGNQILEDACNKLFGNGAPEMLVYYKALADASESCTADSICWYPCNPGELYTKAWVTKIDAAVSDAKRKLNSVTPDQKKRMENQIKLWQDAKMHF